MSQQNLTVAIDFDGVIHRYSMGWHDGTIYDRPMEGAKESMQKLRDKGCKILIFSTRAEGKYINGKWQENQKDNMAEWLKFYQIPYDEIASGKPMAHVYIDDRGLRFENWEDATKQLFNIFNLNNA